MVSAVYGFSISYRSNAIGKDSFVVSHVGRPMSGVR
jgi:hypothetical protein